MISRFSGLQFLRRNGFIAINVVFKSISIDNFLHLCMQKDAVAAIEFDGESVVNKL